MRRTRSDDVLALIAFAQRPLRPAMSVGFGARAPTRRPLGATRSALSRTAKLLGPGVVAGAADNDPTTVATVSVVGSTTAYALGWAALLIFPMLAFVPVSPIHILYVASIAGGIGTPVGLLFLLRVGRDRSAMRGQPVSRGLAVAGYVVAVIVTAFGAAAIFTG